jgi:hypothetical protein
MFAAAKLVIADPLTAPNVPPDTCDPETAKEVAEVRAERVVRVLLLEAVMFATLSVEMSEDRISLKLVPPAPSEKRAEVAAAAPEPIFP